MSACLIPCLTFSLTHSLTLSLSHSLTLAPSAPRTLAPSHHRNLAPSHTPTLPLPTLSLSGPLVLTPQMVAWMCGVRMGVKVSSASNFLVLTLLYKNRMLELCLTDNIELKNTQLICLQICYLHLFWYSMFP